MIVVRWRRNVWKVVLHDAPVRVQKTPGGVRVTNANGPIRSVNSEPALTEPSDYTGGRLMPTLPALVSPETPPISRGLLIAEAERMLLASREADLELQRQAERNRVARASIVKRCRDLGMSWDHIAAHLDMTAVGARTAHHRSVQR